LSPKIFHAKSETIDAPDEAEELTLYLLQQILPADCPVMNEISHHLYVWKD
jgi:hypothetical protein